MEDEKRKRKNRKSKNRSKSRGNSKSNRPDSDRDKIERKKSKNRGESRRDKHKSGKSKNREKSHKHVKKEKRHRSKNKVKTRGVAIPVVQAVPLEESRWHRYRSFYRPDERGAFDMMGKFQKYVGAMGLQQAIVKDQENATKIDVETGMAVVESSGRHRALLIGINYPGSAAELSGCINDVFQMKSFLLEAGFVESETSMQILIDEPHQGALMPTKENIVKGMEWLVHNVQSGDTLFFHFSGHGAQERDEEGHEKDGMNETILPSDYASAGMISDDEIWEIMIRNLPTGVKLVALMDCCHSGTGMDLSYTWDEQRGQWDEEPNPCFTEGDVIMFSGCDDHQTSADAYNQISNAPGGAMTTSFIETYQYQLLQQGERPTFDQFLRGVKNSLSKRGFDQIPQLTSSQKWDPSLRQFDLMGDNYENMNPEKGKLVTTKFEPQTPNLGNSPVGQMLLAAGFAVLVGDDIIRAVGGVVDGVADVAQNGFGAIEDAGADAVNGFQDFGADAAAGIENVGQGFAQEVVETGNGIGGLFEEVGNFIGALFG